MTMFRRPIDVTLTGLASSIQRNHSIVSEPPSPNFNSSSGNLPSLIASGFGNSCSPRALSPHSMLYGDDGGKDQFESNKQQMNKVFCMHACIHTYIRTYIHTFIKKKNASTTIYLLYSIRTYHSLIVYIHLQNILYYSLFKNHYLMHYLARLKVKRHSNYDLDNIMKDTYSTYIHTCSTYTFTYALNLKMRRKHFHFRIMDLQ